MIRALLTHGLRKEHRRQVMAAIAAHDITHLYLLGVDRLPFDLPCTLLPFPLHHEHGVLSVLGIKELIVPPSPRRSRNQNWYNEAAQTGLRLVHLIEHAD